MTASSSVRFIATAEQTRRQNSRRGTVMVMAVIMLFVLIGLASLAVDLGQVQWTKSKLSSAADAAALAAAADLPNTTAAALSAKTLIANNIGETGKVFDASQDLQLGTWDESKRTFSTTGSSYNAVRVTLRRTTARGNAVPLAFGKIIGRSTCDVSVSSVAIVRDQALGMVGLNYVTFSGNADATGSVVRSGVASNGNITLSGSSSLTGDVRPGVGRSVIGGAGRVTGSIRPLTSPLSFPVATAGSYATNNSNSLIPSGVLNNAGDFVLGSNANVTLPAGTYYVRNMVGNGGSTLTLAGPVTFYVTGDITLNGNVSTNVNDSKNFKIFQIANSSGVAGKLKMNGTSDLYADIYSPLSSILISGNGNFRGTMIGLTIDMTGSGSVLYGSLGGTPAGAHLVR